MSWNPQAYEAFADHRMRPAIDLLNRVSLEGPRCIVDLGCGSGGVTLLLAGRWPQAAIVALDGSAEMLASAKTRSATINWQLVDLAGWRATQRYDLVFSNAALHWLTDHAGLFARLADAVAPGAVAPADARTRARSALQRASARRAAPGASDQRA
jgi:trans-aconitate 2-methyltransferase